MKIGCVIQHYGEAYNELGGCAVRSFKKFHPDVTVHHIGEDPEGLVHPKVKDLSTGLVKYAAAWEIMKSHKYDKIIILGADTITCARLDEFIDNTEDDILVTLSYPFVCALPFAYWPATGDKASKRVQLGVIETPILYFEESRLGGAKSEVKVIKEYYNFNSDVACFNNAKALEEIINCTNGHGLGWKYLFENPKAAFDLAQRRQIADKMRRRIEEEGRSPINPEFYHEQGGLNIVCTISFNNQNDDRSEITKWTGLDYDFKIKCVDAPYDLSGVVYNVRSKGNVTASENEKPWGKYTNKFYVKDEKLYTGDHKQIKVWHYCDGFHAEEREGFMKLMNHWIDDWFNEETKRFFKEHCECKDIFEKPFVI